MNADSPRTVVVGLGKMGLPLAAYYAGRGLEVVGCDVNSAVVATVNRGESHVKEEPGLEERVLAAHRASRLRATTDTASAVAAADVVVVIVRVEVDERGGVDFRYIDAATTDIGRGLRPGTLVVYETTIPVGTTRERFGPALERASGWRVGRDFHLAFSPERLMSGTAFRDLERYPKIVGGVDAASGARAVAFYRRALAAEVFPVGSAEAAELSKLIETTYRDVNIALANEFARFAARRGIDVGEAIAAANTQPYSHVHRPGIGVGGHCIPVYPHFLLRDEPGLRLPRVAREVNDSMAAYGVGLLAEALGGLAGRRVLVLGLAYREDVKEAFHSSAIPVIAALRDAGARVLLHDPLYTPAELAAAGAEPVALAPGLAADAIVLQAYHRDYRDLDFADVRGLRAVLDGRNALDPSAVERAGARYLGIGRGRPQGAPANSDAL